MLNIWTIARREYKLYFASPIAYVIAFLMLLVLGIIFLVNVLYSWSASAAYAGGSAPNVQIVLGPMVTLFLFGTPFITMRSMAEEQRLGTVELLLTAPVRDWELIVGKWLGCFLFLLTIIAITWVFPIALNLIETPGIDQGMMMTGYLGIILFSAALVSVGVAISSFFSNQAAAAAATLLAFLVLWLIGMPAQIMNPGPAADLLKYLDFSSHFYDTLYQGIIQLSDVVYYLSVTALGLFLGTLSVEVRRWR